MAELRLAGASTLEGANQVLAQFLPRFNQRFGVPAAQPESAYRPVDPELDPGGVLCIKGLRRVAKDYMVQDQGRALQLFPSLGRPSYAGARVEVQELLDSRLLLRHREQILTPQEAPPLAAELRAQGVAGPVVVTLSDPDPAGYPIWYEDPARRQVHRDLVRAGMERARQQGKHIGRPRVDERLGSRALGQANSKRKSQFVQCFSYLMGQDLRQIRLLEEGGFEAHLVARIQFRIHLSRGKKHFDVVIPAPKLVGQLFNIHLRHHHVSQQELNILVGTLLCYPQGLSPVCCLHYGITPVT